MVSGTFQKRRSKSNPAGAMYLLFLILMIGFHLSFLSLGALAEEGFPPAPEKPKLSPQPLLILNMQFKSPEGNVLSAGKKGFLVLSLVNESDISVENLVVDIGEEEETEDIYYEKSLVLGTIEPHATVSKEIPFFASGKAQSREVVLTARIRSCDEGDSPQAVVRIELKSVDPPNLSVSVVRVRDQNGQSRIEAGKIVLITVRVQNIGTGVALHISANIRTWRDVFVAGDGNTYFELGDIEAGKFVDVNFLVYTGARTNKGASIPVTVYLNEARPQFDVISPLILPAEVPLNGGTDTGASGGK
jgi:hypothetical protein